MAGGGGGGGGGGEALDASSSMAALITALGAVDGASDVLSRLLAALPTPTDEHSTNMARTCLEHGVAHAAPIVRAAGCSCLPFDSYTI